METNQSVKSLALSAIGKLTIFGEIYYKTGNNWAVPMGPGLNVEVSPTKGTHYYKTMVKMLRKDELEGKLPKVDHVRISSRRIGIMFLEGSLLPDVIDSAEEKDGYVQVTMKIGEKDYPVRIYDEYDEQNSLVLEGTYDVNGKVV